ncbi:hypothetical protein E2C01_092758 [Portunus trituberculatus]|uniref:Uncharacterized protein n=1 Tax=Portunus trituberculatus TaxID=210409 RepID=A0A5B7JMX3_PORTR|nr:hypothetical protein [Portunus trituberculatus]
MSDRGPRSPAISFLTAHGLSEVRLCETCQSQDKCVGPTYHDAPLRTCRPTPGRGGHTPASPRQPGQVDVQPGKRITP